MVASHAAKLVVARTRTAAIVFPKKLNLMRLDYQFRRISIGVRQVSVRVSRSFGGIVGIQEASRRCHIRLGTVRQAEILQELLQMEFAAVDFWHH